MMKGFSVSIYLDTEINLESMVIYLKQVKKYGCQEIFTSAHLPEYTLKEHLQYIEVLAKEVHRLQMKLCVDFGGKNLLSIIEDDVIANYVKGMKVDSIRIDYGCDEDQMIKLHRRSEISSFVLNASILTESQLNSFVNRAKKHGLVLSACHNFYPREGTGLFTDFMVKQYNIFQRYGIEVTSCLASFTNPREPLKQGLPTMENLRYASIEKSVLEHEYLHIADRLLIGDPYVSEIELQTIQNLLNKIPLTLHIQLYRETTEEEKKLLLMKPHQIRYDSNSVLLRSQTSRQMAELATKIKAHTTIERKAMSITIDNEAYLRYSGEIQFILQDLKPDDRVNVVGCIMVEDIWKLKYFREGYTYRLVAV